MPTYAYKAVEESGAHVRGALTAENRQVALNLLRERSLFPVDVREDAQKTVTGHRRGIKQRHLATFYQQLSDLLRAGVPMLRALDVLSTQDGAPPALLQVLKEVREEVVGGATLADCMIKHTHIFTELHCSMIRAGEHGGFLEDALARLAIFSEKQDELRGKLTGAMIYPAVLAFLGLAVVIFIMAFVVPKLRDHLKVENYNFMTHVVFGGCDILLTQYGYIIAFIIVAIVGIRMARRSEAGQRFLEIAKLKAPIVGNLITMVAVSRFCRILGTLLQNGVPILQSLDIAKDSAGNRVLSEHIANATENVRRGETLSVPLGESGFFPGDILSMIAVAEESNNLENVLVQIAETHETRTARMIDMSVRIVEPALLVGMALAVGAIAFALLLPILTMGSSNG